MIRMTRAVMVLSLAAALVACGSDEDEMPTTGAEARQRAVEADVVRERTGAEIQDRITRPWWGYHQVASFQSHVLPYDPPGTSVADATPQTNATGLFGMGTTSWTGVVQLDHTLTWINQLGVANIQAARQPLVDALQIELRRRGYEPLTPLGSRTPLVGFALKDARRKLGDLLQKADIRMTVSQNRFRMSLAVFNDMNDVDRLLAVLPKSPPA